MLKHTRFARYYRLHRSWGFDADQAVISSAWVLCWIPNNFPLKRFGLTT